MSHRLPITLACLLVLAACGADEPGTGPSDAGDPPALVVDYPLDGSVFPPDFTTPTVLWHDSGPADAWWIEVGFDDGDDPIRVTSDGPPPPAGEIDPEGIGKFNALYEGTDYQRSARSWTPDEETWAAIQRRSVESPARLRITGYRKAAPEEALLSGAVRISTSKDPVGAPIFYRDVPLMPAVGMNGVIRPLDLDALPRIKWRLRDLSLPESRVLLTGVPSCANCHSFSRDGSTLGMDVDGPTGDKGAYTLAPIEETTVIDESNVISWNSFTDKPEGHRTIGFLSRVSPDGRFVVSTLNEALYVRNFKDFRILQVFYPTRGILGWYSQDTKEMKALPGADDPDYVHCGADWFPGGEEIVFMRARAFDPHRPGQKPAEYPNDPNEPDIQYDLYRMPFDGGKGGTPVPIEGASDNGMSNTFPKISPDGKWIVYTKCKNGLLLRPDGRLWIVPAEGGEAREMNCNTDHMNSWHSFSPNGRWMVFSSKTNTPYTQLFLTHIDEDGNDTPAILIPNSTAANRASNIPEFVNRSYKSMQAIDIPAVDHHVHLQEGIRLSLAGKFEEAVVELEKAVEKEPGFRRALGHLGRALLELGRVEEARKRLNEALELDPNLPFVLVSLGVSYMREGDQETAERYYSTALQIADDNHIANYNMAVLRLEQDRVKEGAAYARIAAEVKSDDADTRNLHGWALLRLGRREEAAVEFRATLEIDGGHRLAQENLLRVLAETGPTKDLLAHMEAVIATRPEDVELRRSLAWRLATDPVEEHRNGKRAVELAKECVKTAGERADVLDVLGAALAETGDFDGAAKAATRAIELAKAGGGKLPPGLEERLAGYRENRPMRVK